MTIDVQHNIGDEVIYSSEGRRGAKKARVVAIRTFSNSRRTEINYDLYVYCHDRVFKNVNQMFVFTAEKRVIEGPLLKVEMIAGRVVSVEKVEDN